MASEQPENDASKWTFAAALSRDAKDMIEAREKCIAMHQADIGAAGREVEMTVRETLAKRLRRRYYVTQGHVLDSRWKDVGQFDLIVADVASAPIIFTGKDQTEYVPYESVYAIGEIKSTFHVQDFAAFVKKIRRLKTELKREDVPSDMIHIGSLPIQSHHPNAPPKHNFRNPLFTFFFAVGGGDFKLPSEEGKESEPFKQLRELYMESCGELPAVLTILDYTTIVPLNVTVNEESKKLEDLKLIVHPQYLAHDPHTGDNKFNRWIAINLGRGETPTSVANLAFLFGMLGIHLDSSLLDRPDMHKYLERLFKIPYENVLSINPIVS